MKHTLSGSAVEDFVASASGFNAQSFCSSKSLQSHSLVVDWGGGCYHQLGERFTASQTMLKYAGRSSTAAPLPVVPSPPGLFLILMPYISDRAVQGQELPFPLDFSCACGSTGPTPAEQLCTLTVWVLVWDNKTILLFHCFQTFSS